MREKVVPTLLELLAIESDLNSDMAPMVAYVRNVLEGAGMSVTIHGPSQFPAICATYGKGGMVFSGHLDTVPLGTDWTREQGEIVDNRLYGRGSTDMKGACAGMLSVAEELVKDDIPFSICLTTDEEEQMDGAVALCKLDVVRQAKGVMICEPTELCPAYREKGVFRFRLTTKGRAVHSSQPWLGEDAILKMHSCLSKLKDLATTARHESTGMTVCFTTIEGGTKNNVVSDYCTTEIDVRFPLPQVADDVREIIVNRLKGEDFQLDVEYTIEAYESDPKAPVGMEMARFLGTEPIVVPYATEAPKYAAYNPNVYICGPGDPHLAHTIDEFVEIQELEEMYDLFSHIARYVQRS